MLTETGLVRSPVGLLLLDLSDILMMASLAVADCKGYNWCH